MAEESATPETRELELIADARLHPLVLVRGIDEVLATFSERIVETCGALRDGDWQGAYHELRSGLIEAVRASVAPRDPERITRGANTTTIRLSRPIREVAKEIDSITLKRPTGKALQKCDGKIGYAYKAGLVAACTGLDAEHNVEKLDGYDLLMAYEEAILLLGKPYALSPGS